MNVLNSTFNGEVTENPIAYNTNIFSEKSAENENLYNITSSNLQEFKNSGDRDNFEAELFFRSAGLSGEFHANLIVFYFGFSVILAIRALEILAIYQYYDVPTNFIWINIAGLGMLLLIAILALLGVNYIESIRKYLRIVYITLMGLAIAYFSLSDSLNLGKMLYISDLQTKGHSNLLYSMFMLLLINDLLFYSFLGTSIVGILGIIFPILMFFISERTDYISFLSEMVLVVVITVYLLLYSSRRDSKQKNLFKTRFEQQKIINSLGKSQLKKSENYSTRTERVFDLATYIGNLLAQVYSVLMSEKLRNEVAKSLEYLQQLKLEVLDWPIHPTTDYSRTFFFTSERANLEINLDEHCSPLPYSPSPNSSFFHIKDNMQNFQKDWNFDVFQLKSDRLFLKCARYLCNDHFMITDNLTLPVPEFSNFFTALEYVMPTQKYNNLPYHNSLHALDVLHSFMYFLNITNFCEKLLQIDLLACIVSALAHDLAHPGLDNFYHFVARSELSITYNDRSVLENMHCAELYRILSVTENNLLCKLEDRDQFYIRKTVIQLILGTDFSTYVEATGKLNALVSSQASIESFNPLHKGLLLGIGLKCADIGHFAKEREQYIEWSTRITKEYMQQDLHEKGMNLEVIGISKSESMLLISYQNFSDIYVLPIYSVWNSYLNKALEDCICNIKKNKEINFLSLSNVTTKAEIVSVVYPFGNSEEEIMMKRFNQSN